VQFVLGISKFLNPRAGAINRFHEIFDWLKLEQPISHIFERLVSGEEECGRIHKCWQGKHSILTSRTTKPRWNI
jgi:hypothetical protein